MGRYLFYIDFLVGNLLVVLKTYSNFSNNDSTEHTENPVVKFSAGSRCSAAESGFAEEENSRKEQEATST